MQLSTIKISNILSFPYVENLTSIEWVKFHNHEQGVINILIGPNGSGKSNLLDIIHAVWKYGLTINFDRSIINNKVTLTMNPNNSHKLTPHRWQEDKPSHIYMSLLLSEDDINNLLFILKERETLNSIIIEHSNSDFRIENIEKSKITQIKKIPLYFDLQDNLFILHNNNDKIIEFIYTYFQHFELIQQCVDIYNNYWKNKTRNRYPLRNTFAFITSDNNFTTNNKPLRLLQKKIENLSKENQTITPSLLQSFFLESLNNTLSHYINLTLQYTDSKSEITFKDKEWYIFNYHELSSGEQSFVSLIFLIYSHDLHNGLIIIDEPELHLHPQSQKKFLELIEDMKLKQHLQCIIATHSPSLINEHNINNVFRSTKTTQWTAIYSTKIQNNTDDTTILQMIKFDHIAKIFFADKIILVEWETDLYFFSFLLEFLSKDDTRKHRIQNYEIITISGKWGVKRRKQFLKKFSNQVFYIGDWDNSLEYGIISPAELNSIPKLRFADNRGSKYSAVVDYLKKHNSWLYKRIYNNIKKLYNNNVFLLQYWDLEAYIGTQSKGLDDTVNFCLHEFNTRYHDPRFSEKREELLFIIDQIFSQKW